MIDCERHRLIVIPRSESQSHTGNVIVALRQYFCIFCELLIVTFSVSTDSSFPVIMPNGLLDVSVAVVSIDDEGIVNRSTMHSVRVRNFKRGHTLAKKGEGDR